MITGGLIGSVVFDGLIVGAGDDPVGSCVLGRCRGMYTELWVALQPTQVQGKKTLFPRNVLRNIRASNRTYHVMS